MKRCLAVLLATLLLAPPAVWADVTLDGSFDAGQAGQSVGSGTFDGLFADHLITDDLGRRYGSNLFHSFQDFDLQAGEVASFVDTTSSGTLRSVIARVTGGPSSIDGLLRSQIPLADLYFLNPGGVLFGPNAALDVPGSFHVSNADFLHFEEGPDFATGVAGEVAVQVSDPTAFGFMAAGALTLSTDPAIRIAGSQLAPGGDFTAVSGGRLRVDDGARIDVFEGRITLVAVDSPGQVAFEPTIEGTPELEGFEALDDVEIVDSTAEVVSLFGGTIAVRGKKLRLDGGVLRVAATRSLFDPNPDLGIDIELSEELDADAGSSIETDVSVSLGFACLNAGGQVCRAPDIDVDAPRVLLTDSRIAALSAWDGGAVRVRAPEKLVLEGASARIGATNWPDAPDFTEALVDITSPDVTVQDGAAILVQTQAAGLPSGRIRLDAGTGDAPSSFHLLGGSAVQAAGDNPSTGRIEITGYDDVSIEGSQIALQVVDSLAPSGISIRDVGAITLRDGATISADATVFSAPAQAGTVLIEAESLELSGNSQVSSDVVNFGSQPGFGGRIQIITTGDVVLDGSVDDAIPLSTQITSELIDLGGGSGSGGPILIDAANLRLTDGAAILTNSGFLLAAFPDGVGGAAGPITITVDDEVRLENGAQITSQADSLVVLPEGSTSGVEITANRLTLTGRSVIAKNATGGFVQGAADAGDLLVMADEITLSGASALKAESLDAGNAGNITIRSRSGGRARFVELAGGSRIETESGVFVADSSGDGGTIDVAADRVTVTGTGFGRASALSASSTDFNLMGRGGAAGGVHVEARIVEILDGGLVTSSSFTAGPAGGVTILADEAITVVGSAEQIGPGGEPFTLESVIESGAFSAGDGGSVTLRAPVLTVDGAQISATSFGAFLGNGQEAGDAGDVVLTGPDGEPAEQIEILGETVIRSDTAAEGAGGSVMVRADVLTLEGEAQIRTSTSGGGDAGTVRIESGTLSLDGDAEIASDSDGVGNGGLVDIAAQTLRISGGAEISSDTEDEGNGGDVNITAERLEIRSPPATSGDADEPGDPDEPDEDGDDDGDDRPGIFANSKEEATGNAGDINLQVGTLDMQGGVISATAAGTSRGGNVRIGARELVSLDLGAEITATVEAPEGDVADPGSEVANIEIGRAPLATPSAVVLNRGSRIAADATGLGARAGNIFIAADAFYQSPDSEVSASAASGPEFDGDVEISSPVVDLQSNLAQPETAFMDGAAMLQQTCAARSAGDQGSFTVASRRGLPVSPEGLLLAYDALDDGGSSRMLARVPATPPVSAGSSEPVDVARAASTGGAEAFRGGRLEEAERKLGEASQRYAEIGDLEQRLDALRGMAQVQQARGDYGASLSTLEEALALAEASGDAERIASVLGSLGNAKLALGEAEEARELLSRAIEIAKESRSPELAASLLNNFGNQQAAAGQPDAAIATYEEAARLAAEADDPVNQAKALSNATRAALEVNRSGKASALLGRAVEAARPLPRSHEKAYVLIHLARSYERLAESDRSKERLSLLTAHTLLQDAAKMAKDIGDARALSYAYGNLGGLYERRGRSQEALYFTHQALRWAEQADAPEALYRWHWQAGRLYWEDGNAESAVRSYQRAVAILQEIRPEAQAQYGSAAAQFRRAVAPVYVDLVKALLHSSDLVPDGADAQWLLREARATVEQLKAAELRDFYRDDCVAEIEAKRQRLDQISGSAAIVYPIVLPDRIELLLSLPDGITRHTVPVSANQVAATVRGYRVGLVSPMRRTFRADAEQLYDWLVRPYAARLEESRVTTLVFVPDGPLRTVPMAALHDGAGYLVERYALAVTPGLSLVDPQPFESQSARLLAAGVSESVQGYNALPEVARELEAIREIYGGEVLLDGSFGVERFEAELASEQPSVVHIASHAVFTGDPNTSFVLAHDERLTMDALSEAVAPTQYRERPLELLTLSACETAAGDERAALGLAGVAIRAGARSALGSLWSVHDTATYELIVAFYEELREPGVSKAEALRRAQRKLIASRAYTHPFYWSPFLLISNWL